MTAFTAGPPPLAWPAHPLRAATRYAPAVCSHPPPTSQTATNFFLNTSLTRLPNASCSPSASLDIDGIISGALQNDRFVPIWNDSVVVDARGVDAVLWGRTRLAEWWSGTEGRVAKPLIAVLSTDAECGTRYFAVDVTAPGPAPLANGEGVESLRNVLGHIESETDAAVLAHAQALVRWHRSARFCARCGSPTVVVQRGAARACPSNVCIEKNIYPRVMPSVLVLVTRNEGRECLLGRKSSWKPGRYSVLAGFSEIFESLEQTVSREVEEETGIVVDESSIAYHSSQPWPSQPYSCLMSAFTACAVPGPRGSELRIDENELEDACWFSRGWLKQQLENPSPGSVLIPGRTSLARRMITEWVNEPCPPREKAPCGC